MHGSPFILTRKPFKIFSEYCIGSCRFCWKRGRVVL
jgi:hypothetical protein